MFSNARQLRLTEEYIDAHFDQLVDCVVRASVSGEHFLVVVLWLHTARRAYETRNLEQLAKLLRSGVPHSRQADQMLADMFGLCKLKRRGGQRKLFWDLGGGAEGAGGVRRAAPAA